MENENLQSPGIYLFHIPGNKLGKNENGSIKTIIYSKIIKVNENKISDGIIPKMQESL